MANGEDRTEAGVAAQLVSLGQAVVQAENASLKTFALQKPRDEAKILEASLKELKLVPAYADEAYYSIPYKDRKTGQTVDVEGLSIDAAMSLVRRWGNCSVGGRILNEDEGGYDVEGVIVDFETNVRISRPHRSSKFIKLRSGQVVLLDEQRQLQALQASVSKAMRNAALAALPAYLRHAYFNQARTVAAGEAAKPADPKKVAATMYGFTRLGITQEMLERKVTRPAKEWVGADLAMLIGLGKAIRDGETNVTDAFGVEAPAEPTKAAPAGAVTPASIAGGVVTTKESAAPPPDEPKGAGAAFDEKARKVLESDERGPTVVAKAKKAKGGGSPEDGGEALFGE